MLLEAGKETGHTKTRGTCVEILKIERALWTFARLEGVEPTYNIAERSIRPLWLHHYLGDALHESRGF